MFRLFISCCLFLSIVVKTTFAQSSSYWKQSDVTANYESLKNPQLESDKASNVNHIAIAYGGQTIHLSSGVIRLFKPVNQQHFGAVFTGKGTLTIAPATELEREEFERQTEKKLIDGKIDLSYDRLVLLFSDSVFRAMEDQLHFTSIEIERPEREAVERSMKYATDKSNNNALFRIMQEMLETNPQPYLYTHCFLQDKSEIFFTFDPRRFEEITYETPPYGSITGAVFWRSLLLSFHQPEEYTTTNEFELARENKHTVDILQVITDIEIEKGGFTKGTATLQLRRLIPELHSIVLDLDPSLTITQVKDNRGDSLGFVREKESWLFLLFLPPSNTEEDSLTFTYQGDFTKIFSASYLGRRTGSNSVQILDFRKMSGSFYELESSTGWYPQVPYLERMLFDMTFRIPDDLVLVGAGKKQSESIIDGKKISRYTTKHPSLISSFSLGLYNEEVVRLSDAEPTIRVFNVGTGDPKKVGENIANSVRLYKELFGDFLYDELKATGSPGGNHGQAFEEFLHLPWYDETVGENESSVSIGLAHEVAHAWWGHGLGWKSYHDQWLSEGFANYSALLYAPFVLKNDEPFFLKLKEWREQLVDLRKYALGSGKPSGSIWLGYRSSSSKTPEDYGLLAYYKGAWVLHMIRMMLIDFATLNEQRFKSMMTEFYQTFRGKDVTTTDFRQVVEKYVGGDMKWFFDQWIYHTQMPTYTFNQDISRNDNGKWVVVLTITQSDVPDNFKMLVPIKVYYKNGTAALARLMIDQPKKEFRYELAQEPDKVVFNPFESVLCKIEE